MPDFRELEFETSLVRNIHWRTAFRFLMLVVISIPLFSQEPPRATIRVEVKTDTGPVAGAVVTLNGISIQTDANGIAITALPLGRVEARVSKEGFLPANASLTVDEAREWQIAFAL